MNQTLTIRPATAADLACIAEHWLAMFEEVGKHQEADFQGDWRAQFCAYFTPRIDTGGAAIFVAVDGETVVATAGALLRDGYPTQIHGIKQGYIFGVRVAPEYRRLGLAERLTREAIALLQQAGCATIRLHASRFGRPIYERLGFVPTNEMELRPV